MIIGACNWQEASIKLYIVCLSHTECRFLLSPVLLELFFGGGSGGKGTYSSSFQGIGYWSHHCSEEVSRPAFSEIILE